MKLKNKVSVITGGNSGIGLGIAMAFQSEGAVGAIVGRNQETLDRSIAALGDHFIGINADVTKMEDLDRIFRDTSGKFGKIDSLVVNAGGAVEGARMGSVAVISETEYDHYMNLNLKSVYFTVQKALPYMKDGGTIVLIGSISGHRAFPGQSTYAAAKAAVISFARGFSLDLLDRNIRVNVLSPGTIDTPVFDKFVPAGQVEHVKNLWTDLIPIGRIGQPSDIGKAAVFLASDESSFVVGTEIIADGGVINITVLK
ncbi:NAD(P)-dependent dehydrogenase, short-chain alcohol dehydrogenase family [Chitinophaga rupis]|uniref:NAD(P)-dependent dehydrogenase, short-chain alcohol dehydrogenase family n=1 Tax=Chitinophaga rupis TaxID=573321 RepID=A0A1H7XHA8_9BACT|nr:SDR family oxidoreductase [Chitinophaga rupis]SEM33140.1 NAD(P)-dependent dehydrogenase, short-chain alcohol dehydrogenase family [Chitinophaga rupis]